MFALLTTAFFKICDLKEHVYIHSLPTSIHVFKQLQGSVLGGFVDLILVLPVGGRWRLGHNMICTTHSLIMVNTGEGGGGMAAG